MMATDWQGCEPVLDGETPYYIYNAVQDRWLYDSQNFSGQNLVGIGGSYTGDALSETAITWTLSGSLTNGYTLVSETGHQFAVYDLGWTARVVTNKIGGAAKNITLQSAINAEGFYSIYTKEKVQNPGRNIYSSGINRLEVQADASYEWKFISVEEYESAQNPTAIEEIAPEATIEKVLINGVLYIRRGNELFDLQGQLVR